jgi:hypothetical protein
VVGRKPPGAQPFKLISCLMAFIRHSEHIFKSGIAAFILCQMSILVSSPWVQEGQVALDVCDNVKSSVYRHTSVKLMGNLHITMFEAANYADLRAYPLPLSWPAVLPNLTCVPLTYTSIFPGRSTLPNVCATPYGQRWRTVRDLVADCILYLR